MRRIPLAGDEHFSARPTPCLLFGPCRLCGGSFDANRREPHLAYHRELFEQYAPERRSFERAVLKEEERLGYQMIAETPGMKRPTLKQVQRHEALYGRIPKGLLAAMGVEAEKAPELPAGFVRRQKRRERRAA